MHNAKIEKEKAPNKKIQKFEGCIKKTTIYFYEYQYFKCQNVKEQMCFSTFLAAHP